MPLPAWGRVLKVAKLNEIFQSLKLKIYTVVINVYYAAPGVERDFESVKAHKKLHIF